MNKQIEEIKKLAETLRLIDELQFDPNHTLSYQRAMCLNKAGYRKASEGEWIDEYKGKYENALYKCSACGGRANIDWITSNWNLTPFCPHCGANMKGEKK